MSAPPSGTAGAALPCQPRAPNPVAPPGAVGDESMEPLLRHPKTSDIVLRPGGRGASVRPAAGRGLGAEDGAVTIDGVGLCASPPDRDRLPVAGGMSKFRLRHGGSSRSRGGLRAGPSFAGTP